MGFEIEPVDDVDVDDDVNEDVSGRLDTVSVTVWTIISDEETDNREASGRETDAGVTDAGVTDDRETNRRETDDVE